VPASIALTQLLGLLLFFKRENPFYLEQTESRLGTFRNEEESQASVELSEEPSLGPNLMTDIQNGTERVQQTNYEKDTWRNLLIPCEWRKLWTGCLLHAFQQLSGVNLVLGYSFYFRFVQDNPQMNLRLIVSILAIVSTGISMYLSVSYKRKPILLIGSLTACL
jgi:hypothetical protein